MTSDEKIEKLVLAIEKLTDLLVISRVARDEIYDILDSIDGEEMF